MHVTVVPTVFCVAYWAGTLLEIIMVYWISGSSEIGAHPRSHDSCRESMSRTMYAQSAIM